MKRSNPIKAVKPTYAPRPIASDFFTMTDAEFDAWLYQILNPIAKVKINMSILTSPRGGALNALANYWITLLHYEETSESKPVPEYNLSDGGASEAFYQLMLSRGDNDEASRSSSGFAIGFELALALTPEAFKSPSGVKAIGERESCALGFQVGFAFALALEHEPLDGRVALQGILAKFFPIATVKTAGGGHK